MGCDSINDNHATAIEPFRIKSVEPIRLTTEAARIVKAPRFLRHFSAQLAPLADRWWLRPLARGRADA